jgi:glyoxylase-like metal-dependent hydrolase (beta-lactamase superfamily II)
MTEPAFVTSELRYAGFCRHPEAMLIRGGSWRPTSIPALFAVLRHARFGVILFDTGYTSRFLEQTRSFPARVYRWLTPLVLNEADTAARQLAGMGIDPGSVGRIIISHFHADHIAGARDFPSARFVATEDAYHRVKRSGPWGRLRRGFLPGLLPEDFPDRVDLLRPEDFKSEGLPGLGPGVDLFGDGSIQLIRLPGHAAGQVGALLRLPGGARQFLIADAAWTTRSIREDRPSHRATGLILDDASSTTETLSILHRLIERDPSLDVVPSHCPQRALRQGPGPSSPGFTARPPPA